MRDAPNINMAWTMLAAEECARFLPRAGGGARAAFVVFFFFLGRARVYAMGMPIERGTAEYFPEASSVG